MNDTKKELFAAIERGCGQCAHLIKTVEHLERSLAIETDTVNKMVMRSVDEETAFMNGFMAGQSAESRKAQGLNAVAPTWRMAHNLWKKLNAQTSAHRSEVTSDRKDVTLPVGEKPASKCHNGMPHYCPNCDRSF